MANDMKILFAIIKRKEKNYEKTDYFRYACLRDDLRCVLVNGMRD